MAGVVSCLFFICAAPFAKLPLGQQPAFVPVYVSVLAICDILTAVLLFGQSRFSGSRPLLLLACGYAFTASMTISYALMFPGLFSLAGLLGAGPQSTSAMYILWHGGFPLLVIGYAVLKTESPAIARGSIVHDGRRFAMSSCIAVIAFVVAYTVLVTAGRDYLPVFIVLNRTTLLGHLVLTVDGFLSLVALIALWRRRPRTVIDVWLMVVMCVWLCDVGLSAILNTGRYDFGWYAGRVYGLIAASTLLVILLLENSNNYARVVRMSAGLKEANNALRELSLKDGLTNLANRRCFDMYLDSQIAVARRHERPVALILFDIDGFKAFNDHYGHPAGDRCLVDVAAAIQSCCRRPSDLAARYGGEEFAVILPDTDLSGATSLAEAVRDMVARLRIRHDRSTTGPIVSLSGGVAVQIGGSLTAESLIAAADQALFDAKWLGKDRIVAPPTMARATRAKMEGAVPRLASVRSSRG
jgi:diguanylate cyclase (GGDEF)-like protein